MALKQYDLSGAETGELSIDEKLLEDSANPQMIKDYLVAIRKNARQWSANTKDRSEVKATSKKPHAQKGLGRARQGSFVAPQYKGGGVVFGPKPKFDQHVRINRKERRASIRSLFIGKIQTGNAIVLDKSTLEESKTKPIAKFLEELKKTGSRVLFVGPSQQSDRENWMKSVRNLPKVQFTALQNVNGYELSLASNVVVLDRAVEEFLQLLGKSS